MLVVLIDDVGLVRPARAKARSRFCDLSIPGPAILRNRVEELIQNAETPVHTVILDALMIIGTDLTACETVIDVNEDLEKRGIRFLWAQVRANVRKTFERAGVIEHLGEDSIFPSLEAAVSALSR